MPANPPRAPGELAEIESGLPGLLQELSVVAARALKSRGYPERPIITDVVTLSLTLDQAVALASLRSDTGDGGEAMGWRPIETAPRDGTPIWAYLFDSGIRQVKWLSVEAIIAEEGGSPEDWQEGFYEVEEDDNEWAPLFWLPLDALPVPPALQPRSTKIKGAGDNA